jgi:hypothetical protein
MMSIVLDECCEWNNTSVSKTKEHRSAPYVSSIRKNMIAAQTADGNDSRNPLNYDFTLWGLTINTSLMEIIMSGQYLLIHRAKQYMYLGVTYLQPELICASICVMQAKTMFTYKNVSDDMKTSQEYDARRISEMDMTVAQKDAIRVYLDKAREYNDSTVAICQTSPLLSYSLVSTLYLKAEILMLLAKVQSGANSELKAQELCEQSIDTLKILMKTVEPLSFHTVTLHCGAYLEMWGLDVAFGRCIQDQAVAELVNLNGEALTDSLLVSLLRKLPVLKRLVKIEETEVIRDLHV